MYWHLSKAVSQISDPALRRVVLFGIGGAAFGLFYFQAWLGGSTILRRQRAREFIRRLGALGMATELYSRCRRFHDWPRCSLRY